MHVQAVGDAVRVVAARGSPTSDPDVSRAGDRNISGLVRGCVEETGRKNGKTEKRTFASCDWLFFPFARYFSDSSSSFFPVFYGTWYHLTLQRNS